MTNFSTVARVCGEMNIVALLTLAIAIVARVLNLSYPVGEGTLNVRGHLACFLSPPRHWVPSTHEIP